MRSVMARMILRGLLSTKHISYKSFSNSVAPLLAIWVQYKYGSALALVQPGVTELLILMYGVVCMLIGLFTLGRRVIRKTAEKLTEMDTSR